MHIPDGYLSPETCAVAYLVAIPTLAMASRRVARSMRTEQVPRLAMFSVVSFLVMMFNLPVPDGTSAHAVGAVVIAIVLGPWAAAITVSVALLFQALLFGDGGVLSYGANVVNMAIIMPFAGVAVYRLVAGRSAPGSRRNLAAAALGGFVGINAAALAAAVEFGVQPTLFHTTDGVPLYAPYPMALTIPAMALAHLIVAGPVEAALTYGVIAYLTRTNPDLMADAASRRSTSGLRRRLFTSPARIAAATALLLVALSPLGLLAPGTAFGEDSPDDLPLAELGLDAVPSGMRHYAGFWHHTLLADYGFAEGSNPVLAYWASALLGTTVVAIFIYALGLSVVRLSRRTALVSGGPRA